MDLQVLVNKAWELKKSGDREGALKLYNEAFDVLAAEASAHARAQEDTHKDTGENEGNVRKILPKYFGEAKRYLKQDQTAAVISNNMAVIFAELGDYESARELFEQAIDLTPDGVEYPDPKMGLLEIEDIKE